MLSFLNRFLQETVLSFTLLSILMALLTAPLLTKEVSKNVTDKSRSSSTARRETAISRNKLKESENNEDPTTATEHRLKSKKKTTDSVSQKKLRVSDKGQGEISTQMETILTKTSQSSKAAAKSRSDTNMTSRVKDSSKSSITKKPIQAIIATTRPKPIEASKPVHRKSEERKGAPSHATKQVQQSSVPSKPSTSKQLQPDKPSKNSGSEKMKPQDSISNRNVGEGNRLNRERTKTRTLDPGNSQLLTTLQHAAQQLPADIDPESTDDKENDYEDDFEDYESDFEEAPSLEADSEDTEEDISKTATDKDDDDDDKENYDYGDSSSSLSDMQINKDLPTSLNGKVGMEEKKMDSGHYDMPEEGKNIGKVMSTLVEVPNHVSKTKLLGDFSLPIETSQQTYGYEVRAINFAKAKQRQQERKASSKLKQRGEILLNMIRLDFVSLPLYDMAPVPYEVYMSSYGRSNTQQVSSQTNEDGMTEEVQTEEIAVKNKWTQHPPALICPDQSLNHPLICAVSSEPCDSSDMVLWKQGLKVNMVELEKFLLNTGQLMLNILEETSSGTQGILKSNKVDLGFSQGFITLGTDSVPFLENRRVTKICFIPHQPNSVLTVHQSSSDKLSYKDDLPVQLVKRCILCVWSLLQPSQPIKILVSSSDVTDCTFHPHRSNLIFAGLADGLINVWDLKEQYSFQKEIAFHNSEWTLKSPSYTTADISAAKHSSAVVGIKVLDDVYSTSRGADHSPTQICSLDEGGLCIIWTLLSSSAGMQNAEDVGIAPWGCVRLLQNESFSLAQRVVAVTDEAVGPNLQFADLALDSADPTHLLAAANTGHAVHGLSSGGRAHPTVYPPHWDCLSPATCICPCPFGLPYFLVGCGDGTVRLHSRLTARPLLSVAGSGGVVGAGPAISVLQWSNSRPCIFFALDCESRLHVWDLASSDMYPMLTIPFKGKFITTMQLSPPRHTSKACPYLALGTSCGKLKVHLVKENFASTSLEDTAIELDKFKRYASIL
ncbi:cytoplasmic dynein 2 intermediate chain 1 isoform X3 [Frankliniella occidentalis]|uniref:Cytoplasmic dynein 2 intermediate chain 1 isoform X3 n=1 Tax=Frankliniella occidentalis TaxID=133901 RepID=A0A9C6XQ79_FRAOC|nr:cytoplasmic dynein 2 intermediate chain 1 isoform X3 [Frankliniella occidentalis]